VSGFREAKFVIFHENVHNHLSGDTKVYA